MLKKILIGIAILNTIFFNRLSNATIDPPAYQQVIFLIDVSGSMKDSIDSFAESMKLMCTYAYMTNVDLQYEFYFFAEELYKTNETNEAPLIWKIDRGTMKQEELGKKLNTFYNDLRKEINDIIIGDKDTYLKDVLEDFEKKILSNLASDVRLLIFSDMLADHGDGKLRDSKSGEEQSEDVYYNDVVQILKRWENEFLIVPWDGEKYKTPEIFKKKLEEASKEESEEESEEKPEEKSEEKPLKRLQPSISMPKDANSTLDVYGRFLALYHWLVYGIHTDASSYEVKNTSETYLTDNTYFSFLLLYLKDSDVQTGDIQAEEKDVYKDPDLNLCIEYYFLPDENNEIKFAGENGEYLVVIFKKPKIKEVKVSQKDTVISYVYENDGLKQTTNKSILLNRKRDDEPVELVYTVSEELNGVYKAIVPVLYMHDGDSYTGEIVDDTIIFKDVRLYQYPDENAFLKMFMNNKSISCDTIVIKTKNEKPIKKDSRLILEFDQEIDLSELFYDREGDALEYCILENIHYDRDENIIIIPQKENEAMNTLRIKVKEVETKEERILTFEIRGGDPPPPGCPVWKIILIVVAILAVVVVLVTCICKYIKK